MKQPIDEFDLDIIKVCVKHNLIPETILRDELITREFHELKESGKSAKDILPLIAEKYFVSVKTIDRIIYETGYKKKR